MNYFELAMEIWQKEKNENRIGQVFNNQRNLLVAQGEFEKAIVLYDYALFYKSRIGRFQDLAKNRNNLGESYLSLNDLTRAADFLRNSLKLKRKVGNPAVMISTLNNLGSCMIQQHRLDSGRLYIQEAAGLSLHSGVQDQVENCKVRKQYFASLQDYPEVIRVDARLDSLTE